MQKIYLFLDGFVMMKNTSLFALMIMTLPIFAACSTAIEGATQQVSFKTVGADDALCDIQTGTNDYRYDVRPPQSIWVQKSRKPMFITCTAPGNRVVNQTVQSGVAGTTFLNTLNGGLGAGWDAESGAMYKYPEEVVIDFSATPAQEQPLPAYMNNGALDTKAQGIEYMGPDVPQLDEDKTNAAAYQAAYDENARMMAEKQAYDAEKERRINAVEGGFYGDKGHDKNDPAAAAPVTPSAPATTYVPPKTSAIEMKDSSPMAAPAVEVPQQPKLGTPLFPSTTSF